MATWTTGETPAAAKFQALDDRVTALENYNAGIVRGSGSYTTNASGQITIPHSLGTTPSQAFVDGTDTGHLTYMFKVITKTSTNLTVQCTVSNTGAAASATQTTTVDWVVFA